MEKRDTLETASFRKAEPVNPLSLQSSMHVVKEKNAFICANSWQIFFLPECDKEAVIGQLERTFPKFKASMSSFDVSALRKFCLTTDFEILNCQTFGRARRDKQASYLKVLEVIISYAVR